MSGLRFRSGWTLERRQVAVPAVDDDPAPPLWTPPAAATRPAVPTVPFDLGELAQWAALALIAGYLLASRRRAP